MSDSESWNVSALQGGDPMHLTRLTARAICWVTSFLYPFKSTGHVLTTFLVPLILLSSGFTCIFSVTEYPLSFITKPDWIEGNWGRII
jgi:hypothetical protein